MEFYDLKLSNNKTIDWNEDAVIKKRKIEEKESSESNKKLKFNLASC
ncbi:hypothetical protein [Spiroplasma endosymbiont of Nebria brevicollis]